MEQLWCTLKYEDIYMRNDPCVADLQARLGCYFHFYNAEQPHQGLSIAHLPRCTLRSPAAAGLSHLILAYP